MPRAGGAYKIDAEWKRRVRLRIKELDISDAEFARRAGISPPALSEVLRPEAVQTTIAREIHEAAGWPAPQVVIAPDTLEALAQYTALSENGRGRMLEKLRAEAQIERQRRDAEERLKAEERRNQKRK